MDFVTSADGTRIAYERAGRGAPIVFVTGAFNDHHTAAPLAAELAGDFTVITYDRRARGESGDTRPYAIEREVDDLAALIDLAGGGAAVFGYSSGALLALVAAAAKLPITRLALYEAPFGLTGKTDLPERLDDLVARGRPGDAVSLFQTEGIGIPAETVAQIRQSPMFGALAAIAQSTAYDATITRAFADPDPAWIAVDVPVLVISGAETWPGLAEAGQKLAGVLPQGRHQEVAGGADHGIPAEATAKILSSFLDG
jgi:pimeloyl-ACP methyl ester carboxylesterase